jgi:acyl-CoA thioesterase I
MFRSAIAGATALLAVLLGTTACGADAMPTTPTSSAAPVRTLAVLGDSLSVSPSHQASFPAVLQRRLEAEGLRWRVLNAGRNGDTTAQGLARLDEVLAAQPSVLVLALGANDGLRGVPVSMVERQLDEIIRRARARGVQVLLCGMETPPLRGWEYTMQFHRIFPGLARAHDVPLVPFLLAGVFGNLDLNQPDLVHPNAAGARRIADTVWPFLEPLVRAGEALTAAR